MKKLIYLSLLIISSCAKPGTSDGLVTVDFEYSQNIKPGTYEFTNKSKFANGFVWYFGDGDSATSVNVKHTYINSGNYIVTLKGFSNTGFSKVSKTIAVSVAINPFADFNIDCPKPFVNAANANFVNLSANAVSQKWDFGDGVISNSVSPSHEYTVAGTFNLKLTVFSSTGDSSVQTKQITIKSIADSLIINKVTIISTKILQWQMYNWDIDSDPDYIVAFGNFIDTTKLRTYVIWDSKAFPLVYDMSGKPFVFQVIKGSIRPFKTPVSVIEVSNYERNVEDMDFIIGNYTDNPNAYPDYIVLNNSMSGETTLRFDVKWK